MSKRVAAIDCGTNSLRLLIADEKGSTLCREMHITRLGAGVDTNHALDPVATSRTLGVLKDFANIIRNSTVSLAKLVATSAVRDASNGDTFLRKAEEIVGFEVSELSGELEGKVAYLGATSGLSPLGCNVVLDIGGGSTEVIIGGLGSVTSISFDMGCVRITEKYLSSDPATKEERKAAEADIKALFKSLQTTTYPPTSRLIGVAGTVTTLAALDLDLGDYDRDRIHHSKLSYERVLYWENLLMQEQASQKLARSSIRKGREDVIAAGALILRLGMEQLSFSACLVSECDILDGLVMELLGPKRAEIK